MIRATIVIGCLALGAGAARAADDEVAKAAEGIEGEGPDLLAVFKTSMGVITCKLRHTDKPKTVANFVALALGKREHTDPRSGKKAKKRYYDGTLFHRVLRAFMIQGGDPLGTGTGGPGYTIEDEIDSGPNKHDRPGILSMANRNRPNTGGSQFFITEKSVPNLDKKHTVFGQCKNLDVVEKIGLVPIKPPNRPRRPVRLDRLDIRWGRF